MDVTGSRLLSRNALSAPPLPPPGWEEAPRHPVRHRVRARARRARRGRRPRRARCPRLALLPPSPARRAPRARRAARARRPDRTGRIGQRRRRPSQYRSSPCM